MSRLLLTSLCALAAGLATAIARPASAAPETLNWTFGVLLDDREIGYHNFSVTRDGATNVVETEAKFDVRFLFVTAFRYRHRNTEIWNDGCLASIDATTDRNGDLLEVTGEQRLDGFSVSGLTGPVALPDCVRTFAYWNPAILESERLLNSQTGDYEDVAVTFEGEETVTVGGEPVDALRYRLSVEAGDITLWYSSGDRRWLALEAPARGGRTLRYRPVAVPQPDGDATLQARNT